MIDELKAEILLLKSQLADAREQRANSEDIRHAIALASADQARDMLGMITQLQEWKAVVVAAQTFVEDPSSVNALFALDEAVSTLTRPA